MICIEMPLVISETRNETKCEHLGINGTNEKLYEFSICGYTCRRVVHCILLFESTSRILIFNNRMHPSNSGQRAGNTGASQSGRLDRGRLLLGRRFHLECLISATLGKLIFISFSLEITFD